MATVLLGLFGNGMVDAFYRCQTPIPFSHFGMEGERSFVCGNAMGQHNQTGPYIGVNRDFRESHFGCLKENFKFARTLEYTING